MFSTFLGGTGGLEQGRGVALDSQGRVVVVGQTDSASSFPTTRSPFGPTGMGDGFLARLSADGTSLGYSALIGGQGGDQVTGLALDGGDNLYLSGTTSSTDFPLANPYQSSPPGGSTAFVTKVAAGATGLIYSTLFGPAGTSGNGIAVDGAGQAHLVGTVTAPGLPLASAAQPMYGGGGDAFVAKCAAGGGSLLFSTYHGGSGPEGGNGISVANGTVAVTGSTWSSNLPLNGQIDDTLGGGQDAFAAAFSAAGARTFSTYLGGVSAETGRAVRADGAGRLFLAGGTSSGDFPQSGSVGGPRGGTDAFLSKIDLFGTTPQVSVAATDNDASEPGTNKGTFTFTRTGPTTSAMTVRYTVSGTASQGMDYQNLPGWDPMTFTGTVPASRPRRTTRGIGCRCPPR